MYHEKKLFCTVLLIINVHSSYKLSIIPSLFIRNLKLYGSTIKQYTLYLRSQSCFVAYKVKLFNYAATVLASYHYSLQITKNNICIYLLFT